MLHKSNTSLSNRALFYPNQKKTLPGHEELQDSNVAKKEFSKQEIENSSFSKRNIFVCKANPRPYDGRRPTTNPREISRQWLEKVGFTFSPFAFIFGTTFLFVALANTLQKGTGKQWLQTLSYTKLPGFCENQVSQKSSWVFLESVLSQYISRDNSLLASTTSFSKDARDSSKREKAIPQTVPFREATFSALRAKQRGTRTFWKRPVDQKVELPRAEHDQPQLYFGTLYGSKSATGAVAGTEFRKLPSGFRKQTYAQQPNVWRKPPRVVKWVQLEGTTLDRAERGQRCIWLPKPGVQIQLSPLWSHHLKKDFLGVFRGAPCPTFGYQERLSCLVNYSRDFGQPAKSVPDQSSVCPTELKRTVTWPWYKITAYYPPNCFIVPTWNESCTTQAIRRLDRIKDKPDKKNIGQLSTPHFLSRNFVRTFAHLHLCEAKVSKAKVRESSAVGKMEFAAVAERSSAAETKVLGPRKWGKERLDRDNEPQTWISKGKSEPDQIEGLLTRVVDQLLQKNESYSSTTLRKMVRELAFLSLCKRAPNWFFSSPITEPIPFSSGHTSVERLRLEDDSIPSKKYSIYSKNKIHQDTLSARVLYVVKKSFYDYGLSIPQLSKYGDSKAQPPTWVSTQPSSLPEVFGNFLGAERKTFYPSLSDPERSSGCRTPLCNRTFASFCADVVKQKVAKVHPSDRQQSGALQPERKPEAELLPTATFLSYPKVSGTELRQPTQLTSDTASMQSTDKQSSCLDHLRPEAGSNALEVSYIFKNITIPKKSFWEDAHYISGYNFPELQDYEVANLFLSKLRFGRTQSGQLSVREIDANSTFCLTTSAQKDAKVREAGVTEYRVLPSGVEKGVLSSHVCKANVRDPKVWPEMGTETRTKDWLQPEHTFVQASRAEVSNADSHCAEVLGEGSTIRYTPIDLKQENRVKKAFKELGRDYSDYLKQPKDTLAALLLSPSVEEDKQIEEEEFKRLAQEKAAAKAAAKRMQNEDEYNTSESATIEEELNTLDPLEVALREGKNNVIHLEESLNDDEIEDSRFERLRFTRELETKKEEEDSRGLALSLTRLSSNCTMLGYGRVGRTELLLRKFRKAKVRAHTPAEPGQAELCSANFVRARSKISGSTSLTSGLPLFSSKAEHNQELCSIKEPSIPQFAPKKVEAKVSDRKHSFFGQRAFWPTRLFSQEERLVSAHLVNPYIRYDQTNPWLILEQSGVLPETTLHTCTSKSDNLQNIKNLQTQARLSAIRFVHFPLVCHANKRYSEPDRVAGGLTDRSLPGGTPNVESALYNHKTGNQQNRIYKPDPRLCLTPLESSLSADWRNERKGEASPFRVTSKNRVHIVLPKLSENQWQKSIEWQLKRHFLDEDTRLESLGPTEPFKTFKYKKIERSLPWLTMAGTEELSFAEHRSANEAAVYDRHTKIGEPAGLRYTEGSKKPSFNLFQWPYKTVGVDVPQSLSDWSSASLVAGCANSPTARADGSELLTCDNGLPRTFFQDGFCSKAWLNTGCTPFRLGHYSRIPLPSSFTSYSKDSSALWISENSLFDVTKKLFSSKGDLNTLLLFEGVSSSSWFLIYRFFLALILKEVLKYIYRISLKDFFIRIINSDFGQTVTSPEFRHKVQFSPFPEFYKPKNRLKDLIGIKNALLPLSEIIWFLRNNCRSRNGPHGVILLGPEGVDTTAIVQAVAGEAKVPVIVQSLRALTLTHSHPQKQLEKVLLLARAKSPCVLFLDELDVIGQSRGGVIRKNSGNGNSLISLDSSQLTSLSYPEHSSGCRAELSNRRLSKQSSSSRQFQSPDEHSTLQGRRVDLMLRLLTVMDGLHHLNGVVIITTSKNTATLDPALLRPGRFDRLIHLTLPNHEQRVELFKEKTRGLGQTDNFSLDEHSSLLNVEELEYLSLRTRNMSGTDILSAINYSTLRAIVNDTVHTVKTLEYGLNCVKALKASA